MTDKTSLPNDLFQKLFETAKSAMPDNLPEDVRKNVRAAIQDIISELDIVTREELDTQKAVLSKTRQKVDEMEKIIESLEKGLGK